MAKPAELSDRELRLHWMGSQRLLPGTRAKTVAAAAKGALTIQAQDVPAASLGVRARTEGLTSDRAAKQARGASACRSWLMRNTVFLFAAADLAWMRPLLAERPMGPAVRRLGQLGVTDAKRRRVMEALGDRVAAGPLPRAEAIELIESLGVGRGENNSTVYWVLHAAALEGVLVVGPALDREQVYAAAPASTQIDRVEGLGRLARRYLDAYGPAGPDDFAYFFKLPKSEARTAWEGAGRTVEVETSRGTLTALPATLERPLPDAPAVRLIGPWDHYVLGWSKGRATTVPPGFEREVHPGAGYLRATALADGLAVGTWKLERRRGSATVAVKPFGKLPRGARPGLEAEAADVGRWLGVDAELRVAPG